MRRDMNRAIASFATLILLLPAAASPVLAQDTAQSEEDTPRLHFFYLGGGLALGEYLEVEDDLKPIFAPFKVKAKETVGTDVRVGYRMHRNIAAELQFQWFSPTTVKVAGIDLLEIETWTFTGNLKGYLLSKRMVEATGGRIHPFLVAGVGLMHFDVQDKLGLGASSDGQDLVARFGGGLDVYVTNRLGIYLDVTYLLATGDVEGLDHVGLSLGALYRFY